MQRLHGPIDHVDMSGAAGWQDRTGPDREVNRMETPEQRASQASCFQMRVELQDIPVLPAKDMRPAARLYFLSALASM